MRLFAHKIWEHLRGQASHKQKLLKMRRSRKRRLECEALEDRSVPSATNLGLVSGVAFIDVNHNGTLGATDVPASGVIIQLNGSASDGTAVSLNTTTDTHGVYTFFNVAPGTYQTSIAPSQSILSPTTGASTSVILNPNQSVHQDLNSPGLAPNGITLREFLASSTSADLPLTQTPAPPVVSTPIAHVAVAQNATPTVIDLAANFSDAQEGDTMAQLDTSSGPIDFELFDSSTPQTVSNFLDYIDSGAYTDSVFHRLAFTTDPTGVPFVLQGGGYTFQSTPTPELVQIPVGPTVQNEFKASNVQGTIAMAKVGSDPNSATDQFFFNLGNNSSNLDNQNGGFTVFGQILGNVSQQTLTTLTNLPRPFTSILSSSDLLFDLPFTGSTTPNPIPANDSGTTIAVPGTTAANYALINNALVGTRDDSLNYSVVSNSNTALVTATITNEHLTLTYAPGVTGTATITVQATDQFGSTVTNTFTVNVG
jgi:cyclophilin family peptidyl-prolyl cis-trans isomerase